MFARSTVVMYLLALLALAGCMPESELESTPTPDRTAEVRETQRAGTEAAAATAEVAARQTETQQALDLTATEDLRAQQAAATQAARVARSTAQAVSATAAAQPILDRVLDLVSAGELSRSDGRYHALDDFDQSWAQINWYQWWYTQRSPSSFVLRANASWESASDTANWWNSGCGFVFREDGVDNHYVVHMGLDGWAYLARVLRGSPKQLGEGYYGAVDVPSGSASLMLVVDGSDISFFVNDRRVLRRVDTALTEGELALTLLSGTNRGYGTRCRMTEIELWELR